MQDLILKIIEHALLDDLIKELHASINEYQKDPSERNKNEMSNHCFFCSVKNKNG